ncbi:hypothetical protein ACJQWK_03857 [Exserohilum turcicum]|uniref:Uncharacterized protein n=1 Tax=Exserohilum turcicum (strain 28A) TaxID=671987 RepID=R0KEI0_EXST2|nr:uncharacterized protein SETTUDRAFT_29824 [Exserohilum turcica Et28A]EOA91268.1 hypothetical protein SETTUDRAFT_29824 [Exserohilum turcica Et28A]
MYTQYATCEPRPTRTWSRGCYRGAWRWRSGARSLARYLRSADGTGGALCSDLGCKGEGIMGVRIRRRNKDQREGSLSRKFSPKDASAMRRADWPNASGSAWLRDTATLKRPDFDMFDASPSPQKARFARQFCGLVSREARRVWK